MDRREKEKDREVVGFALRDETFITRYIRDDKETLCMMRQFFSAVA